MGILYVGSGKGGPGNMEVVLGGSVGGRSVGGGGDILGYWRGGTLGGGCWGPLGAGGGAGANGVGLFF